MYVCVGGWVRDKGHSFISEGFLKGKGLVEYNRDKKSQDSPLAQTWDNPFLRTWMVDRGHFRHRHP